MVDIHSHISPHLDDGADGVEEALLMLNNAFESGTKHNELTPHYNNKAQ